MDREHEAYFWGTLSESVHEFFRDYGLDSTSIEARLASLPPGGFASIPPGRAASLPPGRSASECEMGSIVGLRGANLCGGLAFVAPAALVARMLPVPHDTGRAELQLRDWSGELANPLVGRLKNKLAARALDFDVGMVACFRGAGINVSFLPSKESISVTVSIASARVRVYLDCTFLSPGSPPDAASRPPVREGDVVLF
jgi:hypothetical protein